MEKASTHTKINHVAIRIKASEKYTYSQASLEKLADSIVDISDFNTVEKHYHAFPVQGETLIYVLSESSLVIHTWPEDSLIYLDLLTSNTNVDYDKVLALVNATPGFVEVKLTDFSNQVS